MISITNPVELAVGLASGLVTSHRDGTFTVQDSLPYTITRRDAMLTVSILYTFAAGELSMLAGSDLPTSERYVRLTSAIANVAIGAANLNASRSVKPAT